MPIVLLLASLPAFAADHLILMEGSDISVSILNKCYANVITVTSAATLTKMEAYVSEADSTSATFTPAMWTLSGAGKWTYQSIASNVSVSGTTEKFYSTSAISISLKASTTYAIGYCSNKIVYTSYTDQTNLDSDLGFATYEGWVTFTSSGSPPKVYEAGDGDASDKLSWSVLSLGQDNVADIVITHNSAVEDVGTSLWQVAEATCE